MINQDYKETQIRNTVELIDNLKDIKRDIEKEYYDTAIGTIEYMIEELIKDKNTLEGKVSDKDTKELELGFVKSSLDFALDSGDKNLFNKLSEKYCELVK